MTDQPIEQTRPRKRKRDQLSSTQMMIAAIVAVGLLLAINFSSRLTAGQPLQQLYIQVQAEIAQLEAEQVALITERDYVRSDAYVERWARDEGKMVRPGEVLVVPVPLTGATAQTDASGSAVTAQLAVPVETTPRDPDPWQVWWALFFDSPLPEF